MSRYLNTPSASAAQPAVDTPLTLTRFRDRYGRTKAEEQITLRQLADRIESETAPAKADLPLIKGATFGTVRSPKGSLRHDANVREVFAVEGDYDDGRMPIEDARDRIAEAGLAALVSTTPSHSPDAPRWRIWCPLSGPCTPEAREGLVARLNGVLGGVIAPESFALSQPFYVGSVEGSPATVYLVEGRYLDTADDLDTGAIGRGGSTAGDGLGGRLGQRTDRPDPTRSAYAFSLAMNLWRTGKSEEQVREAIAANTGPAGEWWAEKSESEKGEREQDRVITRAKVAVANRRADDEAQAQADFDEMWSASHSDGERPEVELSAEELAGIAAMVGPAGNSSGELAVIDSEAFGTPMMNGNQPIINLHNAIVFLGRNVESILPGLRHNLMTGRNEWRDGGLTDAALALARTALERRGLKTVGKELVADAALMVATKRAYHPIRDQLAALKWDGTPRLDTWLIRHAGAEDSPYVRAVGRKFLIAMVARVRQPGCKHDHVLVLSGQQGQNKSATCRVLAGEEYFTDTLPSLHRDKTDAIRHLQGKWLVELSELAPSRKADAEDQKAFLSGAVDRVRLPYAKFDEAFPRQCVFVGTTNEDEFLKDPTGGRRYWPVKVRRVIDIAALAAERDQLFAEAVAAYDAGESWWLDRAFEAEHAAPMQAAAFIRDSWTETVVEWLDKPLREFDEAPTIRTEVTVSEVLSDALGLPSGKHGMADQKRAGDVLKGLGWQKEHTKRGNVWRRPE